MSIWLEFDKLGSGAVSSRRDQFLMELLDTPLPGVHFDVVDDQAELSPVTQSSPIFNEGSPRLVDGARESHIVPGYQQTARDWGSDHAAMKILAQGSKGDPSTARSGEEYFSKADGDISHSQCLAFLCRKGPNLLIENLEDKEKICSVLLNMADIVKVLPPANEPLPRDILNMTHWKASLWALVQEMKAVEEIFPSLIGNSGVYVLTASPYSAFLRALATEIADRAPQLINEEQVRSIVSASADSQQPSLAV